MAGVRLAALVRKLRRDAVFDSGGDSDASLLARFALLRDEAAFELLVWRHGAMVLAACRRALGHAEDAEDAFQATFLVLARKARAVRRGTAIPAWLHRVAVRIAHRAAISRRQAATLATEPAARPTPDATEQHELRGQLDAEINRLSEPYRQAFVLCYLEGLSNADAARELGCPVGTIESRLTAARRTLRTRLSHRLQLPAGALAALGCLPVLSANAVAQVKRAATAAATRGLQAAIGIAREPAVRLAERTLHMAKAQKWLAVAVGAALFGLALGIGWARPTAEPPKPAENVPVQPASAPPASPAELATAPPPKPVDTVPHHEWPLVTRYHMSSNGKLVGVTSNGEEILFAEDRALALVSLKAKNLHAGTGYLRSENDVLSAAMSLDGKLLATAEGVNGVKIRNRTTGRVVEALWPGDSRPARQVTFTPDGTKLIVLFEEINQPPKDLPTAISSIARLSTWDVTTWKEREPFASAIASDRNSTFPPKLTQNSRFALRSELVDATERIPLVTKGVRHTIIDVLTGTAGKPITVAGSTSLSFQSNPLAPDGKTLVVRDPNSNEFRVLATDTGKDRFRTPTLRRPVKAIAFTSDSKLMAAATGVTGGITDTVTAPSEVIIWEIATGKEITRLVDKESIRDYSALAFSPNGSFIVAQSNNNLITIWGRLPAPEPLPSATALTKPVAKGATAAPDWFNSLLRDLSAEGTTDARRVEVLFLAALGRFPTDVEARTLAAQLARSTDKAAALRELLGTLTETAEFRAHAAELQRMVK